MIDKATPTTQFHPYEPATFVPQKDKPVTAFNRAGARIQKARAYARRNPALVLGGLAALVTGIGLFGKRRSNTPRG